MNTSVIGSTPAGSMAEATGEAIQAKIRIVTSPYTGTPVIDVPGLSYYGTVTAAAEAVRLLTIGQYPIVHGPVRRSGDL